MPRRLRHDYYTVGWICALPVELVAAQEMLDEEHERLSACPGDDNAYSSGSNEDHNVVIACLPAGRTGTNSAASVAKDMRRSFPSVRFGLMVGTGGGVPSQDHDIRLGDVVVSKPEGTHGGVVQYDFGKARPDTFERLFTDENEQLNQSRIQLAWAYVLDARAGNRDSLESAIEILTHQSDLVGTPSLDELKLFLDLLLANAYLLDGHVPSISRAFMLMQRLAKVRDEPSTSKETAEPNLSAFAGTYLSLIHHERLPRAVAMMTRLTNTTQYYGEEDSWRLSTQRQIAFVYLERRTPGAVRRAIHILELVIQIADANWSRLNDDILTSSLELLERASKTWDEVHLESMRKLVRKLRVRKRGGRPSTIRKSLLRRRVWYRSRKVTNKAAMIGGCAELPVAP